jgi:hypothetical protein
MRDREPAGLQLGKERLHVAEDRLARGRVARVADRLQPGQALDHLSLREMVADEPEPAFRMEPVAVEGGDPGRLLTAMLESVQPKGGDGGSVGMPVDAEHAAFFSEAVGLEIVRFGQMGRRRHGRLTLRVAQRM